MGGMGEVWEIRQHKKWGMGQHLAGLTPGYQGRCNSRNMAMTVPLEVRGLGLEEIKVPENLDTNDKQQRMLMPIKFSINHTHLTFTTLRTTEWEFFSPSDSS